MSIIEIAVLILKIIAALALVVIGLSITISVIAGTITGIAKMFDYLLTNKQTRQVIKGLGFFIITLPISVPAFYFIMIVACFISAHVFNYPLIDVVDPYLYPWLY